MFDFQVARRLSFSVSRKASSVYQFFQDKEELRTAKLTFLVVVVAFICWSPFIAVILCPLLQQYPDVQMSSTRNLSYISTSSGISFLNDDVPKSTLFLQHKNNITKFFVTAYGKKLENMREELPIAGLPKYLKISDLKSTSKYFASTKNTFPSIFWLHFTSCIMTLIFTAISPYIYVFRSEKVTKCLSDLLKTHVYCKYCHAGTSDQLGSPSFVSRISVNVSTNEKERIKTLGLLKGNPSETTPMKSLNSIKDNTLTLTIWRNKLSERMDETKINNNVSTSQCDLSTTQISTCKKYRVRKAGEGITTKLHKTFSCPDGLKYQDVFLESSL